MAEIDHFLRDYVTYNEGTEIPSTFALWCGLAGVSAALGRRVWIDMGPFTLFPNLYIVLVAPSARNRKSTAIGLIENMLREVRPKINIIAQSITPQAMIDALRFKEVEGSNGQVLDARERGEGFIIADELVTFLNPTSYEAGLGSLLLTFFDCRKTYEYKTKSGGSQVINNIFLGLLGGTTTNLLMEAIPERAIGHGLTSRVIFVYADERPKPIFWPTQDPVLKQKLMVQLNAMQELNGEVTFSPDARDLLKHTYETFFNTSPMYEDKFLSGYAGRRHVHHLKLSMLIAIAQTGQLFVEKGHVIAAEGLLIRTEARMGTVMELVTSTKTGDIVGQIRQTILGAGKVTKVDLLRKYSHRMTVKELDVYLDSLVAAGEIQSVYNGNICYYKDPNHKEK